MNTAMTNPWSSQAHAEFIGNYGFWHKGNQKKVAFIYLLGILRVTREHIREIYDFETDEIHPECLTRPWVTPLARRTIMLAYNLYTNWIPPEYPEDCSPSALFDNPQVHKYMVIGLQKFYAEDLDNGSHH